MFSIIANSTKKTKEELGCGYAIAVCIILLGLVFGIDCLVVWACMALWNICLVPVLAGTAVAVGTIKFWPMFGLYLLFGFLFRARTQSNSSSN